MRAIFLLVLVSCTDPTPEVKDPLFPADWATSFTEVRNCRASSDHDLNNIRVVVDAAALGPYTTRTSAIPEGAVVLKPEYDFGDVDCSGIPVQWTVMVRDDSQPSSHLGYRWQRVDAAMKVVSENESRCFNCHAGCGVAPDGYQGTCAIP
ncbi:MAG: cytochrome P460 family protein [Proteobacteria bacterium]|nr:cytochrome P460 family protein [Pseudomonadota bacterium]